VCDRAHRRNDRCLSDPTHTIRMTWIRYLDDDGIDHGHIRTDRNAIVEEAWIFEAPVLVVDVFFVERPTDALYRAALHLSLDITWVHRPTRILDREVTQDRDLPRFRVDLDVDDMRCQTGPGAVRVDGCVSGYRATSLARSLRDLRQRQRRKRLASDGLG